MSLYIVGCISLIGVIAGIVLPPTDLFWEAIFMGNACNLYVTTIRLLTRKGS